MRPALLFVFALSGGFALGWLVSKSTEPVPVPVAESPAIASARGSNAGEFVDKLADVVVREGELPPSTTPAPLARSEEGLISSALRRYALDEIDAGWHETRKDSMPEPLLTRGFGEFETEVRSLPREIGRQLAKERTQTERLASDDPFTVLGAMVEGRLGPQLDIVRDEARFASFFACTSGPRVDGVALAESREPVDIQPGTVIVFPAGVFDIEFMTRNFRAATQCVTIAGAGMDRTLLQFRSIQPIGRIDRFEIRDCTLQSQCDAVELNTNAGVWRAERVRFIGFDCGAGGSSAFSIMRGAILELKACRVEGGFGSSPEHGNLMDLRTNAFLARFDDCTFSTLHSNLPHMSRGSTLLVRRCRFEDLLDSELPTDGPDDGLIIESTTLELREKDAGPIRKRELAEIMPAWFPPTGR